MKYVKGALCGALAMLLAAGAVSCSLGNDTKEETAQAISGETESKLEELQKLIDENYLGDIEEKDLQSGIYEGYISGLGDPYSVYYNEEETKELQESTSGEYEGIGAVMTQNMDTGIITISQIYPGSPAELAGLEEGDILYKVEGKDVAERELTDVVCDIKGKRGTEVELTVIRGDGAEELTKTAVREKVEYPTVEHEMLEQGIGYLRILEFDTVTYDQYMAAFEDMESQGMKGLIVDLRGNPGGSLTTVCDILDEILPEGLIVYTEDKSGRREEIKSDGKRQIDIPLVVLVDRNSASASEIFAGAVQDYGMGEIVGTTTYGKGIVQQIFDLEDGTCVKLTISEYFTPKGRSIHEVGIEPDVEVEYVFDEENPDADNQLEKAAETVKKEL